MTRMEEIESRLSAIPNEIEKEGADLESLEKEVRALKDEKSKIYEEASKRKALLDAVTAGKAGTVLPNPFREERKATSAENRAEKLKETGRALIPGEEVRSVLISGGTLATPTDVSGINDIPGAKASSIIDMVKVVNCTGMGSNKVAYISSDIDAAAAQTEGSAATTKEPTFGFVTITPQSVAVLSYISKQAKKQTPLAYESKVREQALISLRKKAAALVTASLNESEMNSPILASVTSGKGVINEKTLRNIVLAYGGDESVVGGAVLFLNKTDLIAFGDVRGTNEKKAVYEIIPDGDNPNTGMIRDGGLSVRYCINSNLIACSGTAQSASEIVPTMIYGNPQCFELDLFSDYEIRVSEDFAFDKLMDTIRGDVELGGAVVVKNGFVVLTIPKSA